MEPKKTEPVELNDRSRAKKPEEKPKKSQKSNITALTTYVPPSSKPNDRPKNPPTTEEENKSHKGSFEYQAGTIIAEYGLADKYDGATSEAKLLKYLHDRIHREKKKKIEHRKPLEIQEKVLGWLKVREEKRKPYWDDELNKYVKVKNYYSDGQKEVRAPLAPSR